MISKKLHLNHLGSFGFLRVLVSLLILSVLSFLNSSASIIPNKGENKNPICGKIITTAGKSLTLREGVSLTDSEFESVHMRKIAGAQLMPSSDGACAINICGFTSFGIEEDPEYIGTTSDYSDCELFTRARPTIVDRLPYNDKFNVSSLSCGCKKRHQDCQYTDCYLRASKLTWTDNGSCATLFQERFCNSCYLPPVTMSNGTIIATGHSLQFYAAVVRENCYLEQRGVAFSRMWRYRHVKQPILYKGGWSGKLKSAFQSDPEEFSCFCDIPLPTTPTSPVTDEPTVPTSSPGTPSAKGPDDADKLPKSPQANAGEVAVVFVVSVVLILVLATFFVYFVWKRLLQPFRIFRTQVENLEQQQNNERDFLNLISKFNRVCSIQNSVARDAFKIEKRDLENPLGEGIMGKVYQASLKLNSGSGERHEAIAVKQVKWSKDDESAVGCYFREINIFQRIFAKGVNEYIVKFFGACCSPDGLFILTELCDTSLVKYLRSTMRPTIFNVEPPTIESVEGDNDYFYTDDTAEMQWLEKRKIPTLTSEEFLQLIVWCEQIACGMEHLSTNGLIHSDLAARNILLKKGIPKICDFGISKEYFGQSVVPGDFPLNSVVPELEIKDGPLVTTHVDVWSYGCLLWEIFTLGDPLYPTAKERGNARFKEVSILLKRGYRHSKPPLATKYVYEKMLECWTNVPDARPSFTDLRKFFKEIQDSPRDDEMVEENEDEDISFMFD